MNIIYESGIISATNTDVLSGGRLNAIPFNGILTFRFQSDLGTAAAHYLLTLQLPGGDVPVDGQQVLAGEGSAVIGVINSRTCLTFKFRARTGGHFVVSLTETGTAVCTYEAVLAPG